MFAAIKGSMKMVFISRSYSTFMKLYSLADEKSETQADKATCLKSPNKVLQVGFQLHDCSPLVTSGQRGINPQCVRTSRKTLQQQIARVYLLGATRPLKRCTLGS